MADPKNKPLPTPDATLDDEPIPDDHPVLVAFRNADGPPLEVSPKIRERLERIERGESRGITWEEMKARLKARETQRPAPEEEADGERIDGDTVREMVAARKPQ